jgi:ubiquitin-protein ligase
MTGGCIFCPATVADIEPLFQDEAFINSALREFGPFISRDPTEFMRELEANGFTMDTCLTPKGVSAEWLQRPLGDPNWLLDHRETYPPINYRDVNLVDELLEIVAANDPTFQVYIDQERDWEWRVLLRFDEGPYAGLWFHVLFTFTNRYPMNLPQIRFIRPPYHVNISSHGRIYPELEYDQGTRFKGTILKIRELLAKGLNEVPVDSEHAAVFSDPEEYERRIEEARRTNGRQQPEEFTSEWNVTRGAVKPRPERWPRF